MAIKWYKAHSTEYPELIDMTSSPDGVYLRKNVVELPQEEESPKLYEYDEAYLTKEEYAIYSNVDNLTMTALDFVKVLESAGVSINDIYSYLDSHLEVKAQLTFCQNVYCGVVKQLLPIELGSVTITDEMVEEAFRVKNGLGG